MPTAGNSARQIVAYHCQENVAENVPIIVALRGFQKVEGDKNSRPIQRAFGVEGYHRRHE